MASNLLAMASNRLAMASNLLSMASNLLYSDGLGAADCDCWSQGRILSHFSPSFFALFFALCPRKVHTPVQLQNLHWQFNQGHLSLRLQLPNCRTK